VERQVRQGFRRTRWAWVLVPLVLVLAGCSSGGGSSGGSTSKTTTPQQADAALKSASTSVQSAMATYLTTMSGCAKQANPVVCLEAADHTLGDKIHAYANVLAGHHHFSAPQADLSQTLNAAQTLANSLEILGDAQPTQANYDQVLNTFNVNSAITQLQGDVSTLGRSLGT
jgi:hypothetical protein